MENWHLIKDNSPLAKSHAAKFPDFKQIKNNATKAFTLIKSKST